MSQAISSSSGKPCGVARVCRLRARHGRPFIAIPLRHGPSRGNVLGRQDRCWMRR